MSLSRYQLHVSLHGRHYFRTDDQTGHYWSETQAHEYTRDFRARFPEADGFKVTLSYVSVTGRDLVVPDQPPVEDDIVRDPLSLLPRGAT